MTFRTDVFLDRIAPLGLTLLVIGGIYRDQLMPAVMSASLLIVLTLGRFWAGHALDAVGYQRNLSDDRAFPGDVVDLTLRIENRKMLPLTWIDLADAVPSSFLPLECSSLSPEKLTHTTATSWHQAVTWRHSLRCSRRGEFQIGPATLTSGDPFGLFRNSTPAGGSISLVVYPRFVPVDSLLVSPNLPGGGRRPDRWIFEDASRTVGAREYSRGDSPRRLHWKATARRQALQTRVYEPTTELEIVLALALGTFASDPDYDRDPFELGVSTVASFARHFCDRGYPVGLYANGGLPTGGGTLGIAPGSGSGQLIVLLEALARIHPTPAAPVETYLGNFVPRLPWGASVVVFAGRSSPELSSTAALLRDAGRRVDLIVISGEEGSGVPTRGAVDAN